jgi:hypothetical protein
MKKRWMLFLYHLGVAHGDAVGCLWKVEDNTLGGSHQSILTMVYPAFDLIPQPIDTTAKSRKSNSIYQSTGAEVLAL